MTVCAWSKEEFGWKGATEMVSGLDTICGAGENLEDLKKCVKEKTYSYSWKKWEPGNLVHAFFEIFLEQDKKVNKCSKL